MQWLRHGLAKTRYLSLCEVESTASTPLGSEHSRYDSLRQSGPLAPGASQEPGIGDGDHFTGGPGVRPETDRRATLALLLTMASGAIAAVAYFMTLHPVVLLGCPRPVPRRNLAGGGPDVPVFASTRRRLLARPRAFAKGRWALAVLDDATVASGKRTLRRMQISALRQS